MKKFLLAFIIAIITFTACTYPVEAKPKTDWEIVQQLCKKSKKKIKLINSNKMTDKQAWKVIDNRKGKNYIVVEKIVSISNGRGYGWYSTKTKGSKYIIGYNKKIPKGRKVTSYVIWNPKTNICDDVLWVVDNQKYR